MAQDQHLEPRQEAQVEALGTCLERPVLMRAHVQQQGTQQAAVHAVVPHQQPHTAGEQITHGQIARARWIEDGIRGDGCPREDLVMEGAQEGVLVGEPGVDRPHRRAGPPGHLADRQTAHPALGDDLLGGRHQPPHRPPASLLLRFRDASRRPTSLRHEPSMNMNVNSYISALPFMDARRSVA